MADFKKGSPRMADYTPGSAVAVGDVVVTNDTPRVAHLAIAANALGALAAEGGIYEVKGDGSISADKKVYWDATASKVTLTATGNKAFGYTVSACSGDNAPCLVRHDPAA